MAKKKGPKSKKKGNNHYVAAAAAEAAAAAALAAGVDNDDSPGPESAVEDVAKIDPVEDKGARDDATARSAPQVAAFVSNAKDQAPSCNEEGGESALSHEKSEEKIIEEGRAAQRSVPTEPAPEASTAAWNGVATTPSAFQRASAVPVVAEDGGGERTKARADLNIERMSSGEEHFPTTWPGRPYCSEWWQTDHYVKFIVSFSERSMTPETTTVELSVDRCFVKHRPRDGRRAELSWSARLWKRVVEDSKNILIEDDKVHVQCAKADAGVRWESLFEVETKDAEEKFGSERDEVAEEVISEAAAEVVVVKAETEGERKEQPVEEDESTVDLSHLKNSWYEKPPDLIVIQAFVRDVAPQNLFVDFQPDALHFRFRTSDPNFLKIHGGCGPTPSTSSTLFSWSIRLKNLVDPASCSYKMSRNNVEITLKKRNLGHWVALEASSIVAVKAPSVARGSGDGRSSPTSSKSTPTTNSKPTYSNVSHLRGDSVNGDGEASTSASVAPSGLRSPVALNHCNTTTVASSVTKPTCMVSPLPPARNGADQQQRQREVQIDEMETNVASTSSSAFSAANATPSSFQSGFGSSGSSNGINNLNGISPFNGKGDRGAGGNYFGMTGLHNMGNTCFMNSVLQCLANTRELRDFFHQGHFQKDLNRDNPLGLGGNLAISFAVLLKVLWGGSETSYAPSKLKSLIAQRASQFTGFAQHDAQEFLAFLLDGLHEDLNRVVHKPYTTPVEPNGRPDNVVADEAWRVHRQRNDSQIDDLFSGQYKSKLTCPVCDKVSVTFDPFTYLTIPLPKKKLILPVTVVWRDPHKTPVKYLIPYSKESGTVEDLKNHVAEKTAGAISPANLRVFEIVKSKVHKVFERAARLDAVQPTDQIFIAEKLDPNLAPGEKIVDVIVMQRTLTPATAPTRCSFCRKDCLEGFKLRRCTKCLKVGYCDQSCQRNHWSVHKPICRKTPDPIGVPFALSLPESQITYRRLVHYLQSFAAFSVDTFKPPSGKNVSGGGGGASSNDGDSGVHFGKDSLEETTSDGGSAPASPAGSDRSGKENPTSEDDDNSSGFISAASSATNTPLEEEKTPLETPDASTAPSTSSSERPSRIVHGVPQSLEDSEPAFLIRAVDQKGFTTMAEIREESPNCLIDLSDKPYLAMDWKNYAGWEGSVMVTSRADGFHCVDGDPGANSFAHRLAIHHPQYQQQHQHSSSPYPGPLFHPASSSSNADDAEEAGGMFGSPTLDQCLEIFTEAEILGEEDLWYCPSCKEHRQASKQMTLWKLPKILILHMKRFSFRNFIWRDKINKFVDFPLRGLDLRKYCPSPNDDDDDDSGGGGYSDRDDGKKSSVYDLYAVINHFGGIMGGHYTAYARLPSEGDSSRTELPWRLFDDSHVTTVGRESDVVTRNAYVLFYVRRDPKEGAGSSLAAAAAAIARANSGFVAPRPGSLSPDHDDSEEEEAEEEERRVRVDRGFHGNGRSATAAAPREEEEEGGGVDAGAWRKGSDASTCTEDTLLSSPGTDCDEID